MGTPRLPKPDLIQEAGMIMHALAIDTLLGGNWPMRVIALCGNYRGVQDNDLGLLFFSTADPNGGRSAHLPALLHHLPECFFSPTRWAVEMTHSL